MRGMIFDKELNFSRNVKTCGKEETIGQVISDLRAGKFGSIIIAERNKVQGIFTERDLLKKVVFPQLNPKDIPLEKVATPNPHSVHENTHIHEWIKII